MTDNSQPQKQDGLPIEPTEAETEFLNCYHYDFTDTNGDWTRRPSRGPITTQMRPDQPSAPPTEKDKQG